METKKISSILRIVFLGAPGSGKGTQSTLLSKKLNLVHISTGEMLRAEMAASTPIGNEVRNIMDAGHLVPDKTIIELLRKYLSTLNPQQGFVLDGFPRTVVQAKALDDLLNDIKRPLSHILELSVDEGTILGRIRQRAESGSGRSDDNDEIAANRYKVFMEQTMPVIQFYQSSNRLKKVDGLGSVEEVQKHILGALGR